jgi:hypothetical protein
MGTWYNDAPQEFHAWMQKRFHTPDRTTVPLDLSDVVKLREAWEQGNAKGKGELNGNTL